MNDAVLRERMGAAAHDHAQHNFDIDRMLDSMEAVFARVLEGSR